MKLTEAHPNKGYRWYRSFLNCRLEACISPAGKITFYEVYGQEHRVKVKEEAVKKLFPTDTRRTNRPFLHSQNPNFYAVLMRHRKKYKPIFEKLCEKTQTPKMKRKPKLKRKFKRKN